MKGFNDELLRRISELESENEKLGLLLDQSRAGRLALEHRLEFFKEESDRFRCAIEEAIELLKSGNGEVIPQVIRLLEEALEE